MRSLLLVLLSLATATLLWADGDGKAKPMETMTVKRCRMMLNNGKQCPNQAESGKSYCWKHNSAVRAINGVFDDASVGASNAWQATKSWSTNVWQATKDGADRARVGIVELFGGVDAKPNEAKKNEPKSK